MEAHADQSPEEWAHKPPVEFLLANILTDPGSDYAAGVAQLLDSVLLDAHVFSIVRALKRDRELHAGGAFSQGFSLHLRQGHCNV